jgi:hypothetical protein
MAPAAWEMLTPVGADGQPLPQKVLAVLVPHTGSVSSEWSMKFREMPLPPGSQIFFSRGMPIDVTRENMVKAALDFGFEWMFFLDSDVILPPDAIKKLLSHNLPLACGMYKARWVFLGSVEKNHDARRKRGICPDCQVDGGSC